MAKNIFNNFQNCLSNKAFDTESGFSSWQFCRFLSCDRTMLNYACAINCYSNQLNDYSQYCFIQSVKRKPKFIRWIIPKTAEPKDDNLEPLMRKYNISKSKAQEYLKLEKLNDRI